MTFVGRIDRIDSDGKGNFAIYDYKSSLTNVSQYGSWLKNNRIQLLLYAMAVENGLTIFDAQPVVAALYYSARPLGRDYGFKMAGVDQRLFSSDDRRRRNLVAPEERAKLFEEARGLVRKAVDGIRAGRFAPEPRDTKGCMECQWRSLCRAPHLSS